MKRSDQIEQLSKQQFDLLIIGGGIVGAGIARDASLRGLKAALIEQGDFASGTSSKTSKLIHGGLRYLEHGHLHLVFESLQERRRLHRAAPALVRPIPLLIPIRKGDSRPGWKIRVGLQLYQALSLGARMGAHRIFSPEKTSSREPALSKENLEGGGLYADCQMDDARLCLQNILDAGEDGAVCCNYVRMESLLLGEGRVCGAAAQDLLTGKSVEIQAQAVVNAAGPWGDRIRSLSQAKAKRRLAPTKGIHLVLPRAIKQGLFVEAKKDKRMLFLLPWGDSMLVGTTESALQGPPENLQATAEEVGYLLEEVNRVLPEVKLTEQDVITTFAGARPLLSFSGSIHAASREHQIEEDAAGLVSVMGGKYSTYRRMAEEAVNFVVKRQRWSAQACQTATAPLGASAAQRAAQILHLAQQDPGLGEPVCSHHSLTGAELVYSIQEEMVCTITDLLARRSRIAWRSCSGLDFLPRLSGWLKQYGRFDSDQIQKQEADYRQFLSAGTAFRQK